MQTGQFVTTKCRMLVINVHCLLKQIPFKSKLMILVNWGRVFLFIYRNLQHCLTNLQESVYQFHELSVRIENVSKNQ